MGLSRIVTVAALGGFISFLEGSHAAIACVPVAAEIKVESGLSGASEYVTVLALTRNIDCCGPARNGVKLRLVNWA